MYKQGNFQYNDDGTVATLVQINGTSSSSGGGDLPVSSNSLLPIDIQSRLASTIQVISGAVVTPTNGSQSSAWIDCDGFADLAVTVLNDGAFNNKVDVYWSNDGTNFHGFESIGDSGAVQYRAGSFTVKSRYAKLFVVNRETAAPHTMSAWAYLKA